MFNCSSIIRNQTVLFSNHHRFIRKKCLLKKHWFCLFQEWMHNVHICVCMHFKRCNPKHPLRPVQDLADQGCRKHAVKHIRGTQWGGKTSAEGCAGLPSPLQSLEAGRLHWLISLGGISSWEKAGSGWDYGEAAGKWEVRLGSDTCAKSKPHP